MTLAAIVVVAYGPGQVTKDAVARATALAGTARVMVVPAVAAAERLARRARSARVEIAPATGRAGLGWVLDQVARGDVLLVVHDDVLVLPEVLEAMVSEHATSGHVTVPWSNDRASETSLGALPPVRQAASETRTAAAGAARGHVRRVRPACLVLAAHQLRRLLPARLTVARTILTSQHLHLTVAANAVVAHDSTCLDQLEPPTGPEGRPLVAASLIVRDEESMLGPCLESLTGLVDRIVVCDTGSIDATIAIAREHGAEVIERPWRNDFAWARNEALDPVRDAWYVLHVDADERLAVDDVTELRRTLATDVHDTDGFEMRIDNLADDGHVASSHLGLRLFRPDGVRFVGALHEMPFRDDHVVERVTLEGLALQHLGYQSQAMIERDKATRNLEISRREHEMTPNGATALHLARSIMMTDQDDPEVTLLLERALASDDLAPRARAHALGLLGSLALRASDWSRASELGHEAVALVPRDDGAAWVAAHADIRLEAYEQVIETWRWRHSAPSEVPYSTSADGVAQERYAVMIALSETGRPAEARELALQILDGGQALEPEAWQRVAELLLSGEGEDDGMAHLVAAARRDPSGNCITAVAKVLGPEQTAEFAAAVVAGGTTSARVIRTGLSAALVSQREDVVRLLAAHAHLLEPAILDRLVRHAREKGNDVAAAILTDAVGRRSSG